MKYLLTALWTIICIGVLAYSHITWNKQTSVQAVVSEPTPTVEQDSNELNVDDKYLELAANWPESAKEQLKLSLKDSTPFNILFVGSSALQWGKRLLQV